MPTSTSTWRSSVGLYHGGVLIDNLVKEWAQRHGRRFNLHLTGPAGGWLSVGTGGPDLELEAVELCQAISGRADGKGLLPARCPSDGAPERYGAAECQLTPSAEVLTPASCLIR